MMKFNKVMTSGINSTVTLREKCVDSDKTISQTTIIS